VVYNNFLHHTETYVPRSCSLNLNALGWEPRHLEHLDIPFVEEEIKKVISSAPKEKAPGQMVTLASSSPIVGIQ
jgi:hypothetical protein